MNETKHPEKYASIHHGPVFAVLALAALTPFIIINIAYRLLKRLWHTITKSNAHV